MSKITKQTDGHVKRQISMRFDDDVHALLDELAETHGGKAAAVVAGLRALHRGAPDPTPEQALEVLRRAVKDVRP